ncbi:LysR family transcriptional regulator [Bacillus taeanensis]|uniref:LysR family transcriptional regulator n=1 Tax=Bacillus taeanensis TaxID=273032 RepID=A0A366XR66_9BACI|nr:LysR family transcriptional regulator [Bacillus taeanensis]RBW68018.1 LysR family transcriptional regulator [Bacillus taeanensis]
MDIRWLKTFVTAAQYENFHRTAEKLFLAQPTVTVHIKNLENAIGMSLFERKGRNIFLTPAGNRFLPYAKKMLIHLEKGILDIESWRQGYKRHLTLAVSPLIAVSILPSLIREFIKKYPDIQVSVNVLESKQIGDCIQKGDADIGLSRMNLFKPSLSVKKLYDDPVILAVPHDGNDLEQAVPLDFEQLIHQNNIITDNHPEYWDDLLIELRNKYPRIRTMAVSQVHVTKRFIEEGLGVSFLPRSTVKREVLEGRILELVTNKIRLPTASSYLITKYETTEITLFSNHLLTYFST